jgi:hypothetical protein
VLWSRSATDTCRSASVVREVGPKGAIARRLAALGATIAFMRARGRTPFLLVIVPMILVPSCSSNNGSRASTRPRVYTTLSVVGPSHAPEPTYCSLLGWYGAHSSMILMHDVGAGTRIYVTATDGTTTMSKTVVFRGGYRAMVDRTIRFPLRATRVDFRATGGLDDAVPSSAVMHRSDFLSVSGPECE